MNIKTSPQLIGMLENNSDPWGIKIFDGDQSVHFYSNPQNYKLFNLPSNFNLYSKTDSEIPHPISEYSENFQSHDIKTLKQKKILFLLIFIPMEKIYYYNLTFVKNIRLLSKENVLALFFIQEKWNYYLLKNLVKLVKL